MKRVIVIAGLAYLCFFVEFILYNTFGPWGKPELLILLFVFFNLYMGIRYSIVAALIAALLKEASGGAPLGTYVFVYIVGAYWTTFVSKNLYQPGSRFSRAVVAFFVVLFCFILEAAVHMRVHEVRLGEMVSYILAPQLITTMIAATFVFLLLRDVCVLFDLKKA